MGAFLGLHGFTQTGHMFDEVSHYLPRPVRTVALPGHEDHVAEATFAAVARSIDTAAGGQPPTVIGYSMGGRLGLRYCLERPAEALILISANAGIADPQQRAERVVTDQLLADRLVAVGCEAFIDEWLARDIFAGLNRRDDVWRAVDRQHRLTNSATELARALVGFSQGTHPYLGDRLSELEIPTLVIAGSEDEKYVAAAQFLSSRIPDATIEILDGVGHCCLAEAPEMVGDVISRFLYGG